MEKSNVPLISVVLPVYNVGSYINEAIQSILDQTITDFEILVVDDCSTDNTIDVVSSIQDKRIKIIRKEENKGLIDSLNIGFAEANGKYIARMDGDDVSHKERFEKQLYILENYAEIKACGCWLQEFDRGNKTIKHKEFHNEIVARLLIGCSMSLGSVMLNREWAQKNKFDEKKKHVEDYDFWSRTAWTGKFHNLQETLYFYRVHQAQVSNLYTSIQKLGDVSIKLFLFKKIKYDTLIFTDNFIEKFLMQSETITVKEFSLFLEWLKKIVSLNKKQNVFDDLEFKKVINEIKTKLIFKIYFQKSNLGITKEWRIKSMFSLSSYDLFHVLKNKTREIIKEKFTK